MVVPHASYQCFFLLLKPFRIWIEIRNSFVRVIRAYLRGGSLGARTELGHGLKIVKEMEKEGAHVFHIPTGTLLPRFVPPVLFFSTTFQPRAECYSSLRASNASPPRNRLTFLHRSRFSHSHQHSPSPMRPTGVPRSYETAPSPRTTIRP